MKCSAVSNPVDASYTMAESPESETSSSHVRGQAAAVRWVALTLLASLCTGCSPWFQSHGPTLVLGVEFGGDQLAASPVIHLGYSYDALLTPDTIRINSLGAGTSIGIALLPTLHELELVAEIRLSLLFVMNPTYGLHLRRNWRTDTWKLQGSLGYHYTLNGLDLPEGSCADDEARPCSARPGDVVHETWFIHIRPFEALMVFRGEDRTRFRIGLGGGVNPWN